MYSCGNVAHDADYAFTNLQLSQLYSQQTTLIACKEFGV